MSDFVNIIRRFYHTVGCRLGFEIPETPRVPRRLDYLEATDS